MRIATRYLNHPALTLGYRLAADGAVLVHASDHEPYARELGARRGKVTGQDQRHAEFIANADLVIHDAQYTPTEFLAKVGWGHSTGEYAARLCATAGARRLALIHHDPTRTDDEIDLMVQATAESLGATPALEVFGAAEGMTMFLPAPPERPTPDGLDRAAPPIGKLAIREPSPVQCVILRVATRDSDRSWLTRS